MLLIVLILAVLSPAFFVTTASGSYAEFYYTIPANRLPMTLDFAAVAQDETDSGILTTVSLLLYETNTGNNVTNVTYVIKLSKPGATGIADESERILVNVFHSQDPAMVFALKQSDESQTSIEGGYQEQFINAWVPNGTENGMLTIVSPSIQRNETYSISVEVLGIDDVRNLLKPEDVPKAEFVFTIGIDARAEASIIPRSQAGIQVGGNPTNVVVSEETNLIYVADFDSSITVIDGASNQVVHKISLNLMEDEIAQEWKGQIGNVLKSEITDMELNPVTNILYVAKSYHFALLPEGNASTELILSINGSTNMVQAITQVGSSYHPVKLAVDQKNNLVYFIFVRPFFCTPEMSECGMSPLDTLYALNGTSIEWKEHRSLYYQNFIDIAIDPASSSLYLVRLSEPSRSSLLFDPNQSDSPPEGIFVAEGNITNLAFDPELSRIYALVSGFHSEFIIADADARKVLQRIDIEKPSAMAFNPQSGRAYVTYAEENNVSIIDASTADILDQVTMGGHPTGIDVNSETNMIYVAKRETGVVSVIDGMNNVIVPEFAELMAVVFSTAFVGVLAARKLDISCWRSEF